VSNEKFFEEQDQRSVIKTLLVERYFRAWAKIVQPHSRGLHKQIVYLDLFAGPGRYEDGSASTPIQLINHAISDPKLRNHLVTMFTDIAALPGITALKYQPEVWNDEVGSALIEEIRKAQLVPTLFFIDPWGYKGLSLDLIGQTIKGWGSDCIFFFNYNRINPGLTNSAVHTRMTDLFGGERLALLQGRVATLSPTEREEVIIRELSEALRDVGGQFVLPFQFKLAKGTRTSHYIILLSHERRNGRPEHRRRGGEAVSLRASAGSSDTSSGPNDDVSGRRRRRAV
jgi:three-Cys-motif partner protein